MPGGMRIPIAGGGGLLMLGILVVMVLFSGIDFRSMLGGMGSPGGPGPGGAPVVPPSGPQASPTDPQADFVSAVLASTEDTWPGVLSRHGVSYPPPQLVLFDGSVSSACGYQSAAVGPFYCPGDRRVYLDLAFFRELDGRFGAPGDFAQAYVIAHEIGHHVQNVLGVSDRVDARTRSLSEAQANDLSVRVELQADCFAGGWGHHAQGRGLLEPGDVEEGLRAASAIGDDRLQREAQGYVVPESFTHGSSEQRMRWFRAGLAAGDITGCDTFAAQQL